MMSPALRLLAGFLVLFVAVSLVAQDESDEAKTVFPAGKAEAGMGIFVEKGCYQCHSAGSTKLPPVDLAPRLVIELGGDVHRKWTRDDYARAIMDPNLLVAEDYKIAMIRLGDHFKAENSPMPTFADVLKVTELVDLVSFLDSLTK